MPDTLPTETTIPIPDGVAKILKRSDLQDCAEWKSAFQTRCKDHRFYEIIEQTLTGTFDYHYLVIEDHEGRVRAIQPMFFVQQNLVEGVGGMVRTAVKQLRRIFPNCLTMRMLMVGCAAGEGHLGACLGDDEEWTAKALHDSLKTYAKRAKASLVVLKDFSATYRPALTSFSSNGYARIPSMPMTRLSLNYSGFEDYLGSLSKATRKDLRRKFKKTASAAPIEMEVLNDVTPHVDEIYPLYLQVHNRSALKFETLTKDYFCRLGREMPERTRFFIWRQLGKIVAFSLCMVHAGTIYDDYLGLDYDVALDLHLYFYTLRDIITWSLKEGLQTYCSSPLNYAPKLHLGCHLAPLDLYVMHTAVLLNPVFHQALKFLGPTRHDPVLHRFSNAHEL